MKDRVKFLGDNLGTRPPKVRDTRGDTWELKENILRWLYIKVVIPTITTAMKVLRPLHLNVEAQA